MIPGRDSPVHFALLPADLERNTEITVVVRRTCCAACRGTYDQVTSYMVVGGPHRDGTLRYIDVATAYNDCVGGSTSIPLVLLGILPSDEQRGDTFAMLTKDVEESGIQIATDVCPTRDI